MTEQTQAGVTHIWPYNKISNPDAKPFSSEREEDVWEELRELTLDEDVRGNILFFTHEQELIRADGTFTNNHEKAVRTIEEAFYEERAGNKRLAFVQPREIEQEIFCPATEEFTLRSRTLSENKYRQIICPATEAHAEVCKKRLPIHLGSKQDAKWIIDRYFDHEICALVLWHPEFNEYGPQHYLKHLPMVRSKCPDLPIYIFHWDFREDKWGVEREDGSRNWEDVFPALSDLKPEHQEIIVENMLIKGNVHIVAGPPETFKTMGLIELSSAVLDERPVFDMLEVKHRYPIMFLCADMSPVQFDEWAAPFNLRKHGTDFRVKRADYGIPSLNDPALQEAVRGRILILDTMLDFAKIQKAFESGEWTTFMDNCRTLMNVYGCVAVVMTAHSTRAEVKSDSDNINKAEYFKDSVTFHGKTDIGFGCKVLKGTSQIKWERIKSRGFKYGKFSFTVAVYDEDGNSNLDQGRFPVCTRPEDMKELAEKRKSKGGRKPDPDRQLKIEFAKTCEGSSREIADAVNAKFGSNHDHSTIAGWLKPFDEEASS